MDRMVGFIGLGIMGKPMAKNLVKGGCSLLVNDLNGDAVKELTDMGAQAATLKEIGEKCPYIERKCPIYEIEKLGRE